MKWILIFSLKLFAYIVENDKMKTYKLYSLFGGKIDSNHYLAHITWIYIPTFDYDS